MNRIINAEWTGKDIRDIRFENRQIAKKFRPGQFLIVQHGEEGERIPLTIAETGDGIVRIILQKVGFTTEKICSLSAGDDLGNVAGPLGHPTPIEKYGTVICVAGGIGSAPLLPVASALAEAGNRVITIEGVRSKEYLILSEELKAVADQFILTSDDGTAGLKGLVTQPLLKLIDDDKITPDLVYAVGPPVMMQAVSRITRDRGLKLLVSLNPIMVDGTGMCGACRVEVGGVTKFACVDGPEFDGNSVDYGLLMKRLATYKAEEGIIREKNCCGEKHGI